MRLVYFVYQDTNAYERQSDGVDFCKIPEFHNDKIYFYCDEYSMFWDSIDKVGNPNDCCNFSLKSSIVPATLLEISNNDLISYIDTVKEYIIENNKLSKLTYIHIK